MDKVLMDLGFDDGTSDQNVPQHTEHGRRRYQLLLPYPPEVSVYKADNADSNTREVLPSPPFWHTSRTK